MPAAKNDGTRSRAPALPGRSRIGRLLLWAVIVWAVGAPRAQARSRTDPSAAIVRAELKNGVHIVVERNAGAPVVAIRAIWAVGTARLRPPQAAMAKLVAATVTGGCGARSTDQVAREMDAAGGVLSGFAGTTTTGIAANLMAATWQRGLDVVADCILSPHFEANTVAAARRRLSAKLAAAASDPATVAFRTFVAALYPHRASAAGNIQLASAVGANDVIQFYHDHYSPSAVTIAVVGDVDPEQVIGHVRARLGDAPRSPAAQIPVNPPQGDNPNPPIKEVYRYLDTDRAQVIVGYRGLPISHPGRHTLDVLVAILDDQLAAAAREQPNLAFRVGALAHTTTDPGFVAAYIICPPERVSEAAALVRKTIARVAENGPSDAQVQRAARFLAATHRQSLLRSDSQAAALGYRVAHGVGLDGYLRYALRVRKVTPQAVRRLASELFARTAVVVTVMPETLTPAARKRTAGPQSRRPRGES
ncbi:MAG TPA: pitrilysin family protein [Kofleriaceae bacterium]|nr:pitrilysin family protein [Kofleriaceae bacterium]